MKKKHIKWLAVIAWMILIFVFSNMPGNESDEKSKFVIYIVSIVMVNFRININ